MNQARQLNEKNSIISELLQQPQALKQLSAFYAAESGQSLLRRIPSGERNLFVGSGSSFWAASQAARQCCLAGVDARALEAEELLSWPKKLSDQFSAIFMLAPDKDCSEVGELIDIFDPAHLVVLTNQSESEFSRPVLTLPLCAGHEEWDGSKTFINAAVLLWLVCRRIIQRNGAGELDPLKRLCQYIQLLLEGREALFEQWNTCLQSSTNLLFTGSGLQTAAARRVADRLTAWAGVRPMILAPDQLGARHAELTEANLNVVLFQGPSEISGRELAASLALQERGARLIRLKDGFPQPFLISERPAVLLDVGLSPLLNVVSGQLLAASLRPD